MGIETKACFVYSIKPGIHRTFGVCMKMQVVIDVPAVDVFGYPIDSSQLDGDEQQIVEQLYDEYSEKPDCIEFKKLWWKLVIGLYDQRKLSRKEIVTKPLFKIAQFWDGQLMVEQGLATVPHYREQLRELSDTYPTRRVFCDATGLSEDMLSHVLHGRKEISIPALDHALSRIGYAIRIVPLAKVKP